MGPWVGGTADKKEGKWWAGSSPPPPGSLNTIIKRWGSVLRRTKPFSFLKLKRQSLERRHSFEVIVFVTGATKGGVQQAGQSASNFKGLPGDLSGGHSYCLVRRAIIVRSPWQHTFSPRYAFLCPPLFCTVEDRGQESPSGAQAGISARLIVKALAVWENLLCGKLTEVDTAAWGLSKMDYSRGGSISSFKPLEVSCRHFKSSMRVCVCCLPAIRGIWRKNWWGAEKEGRRQQRVSSPLNQLHTVEPLFSWLWIHLAEHDNWYQLVSKTK